jgi:hypothetical protein
MKLAASGDLTSSFTAAASSAASAPTSISGTLSTTDGATATLSGTFDVATGALHATGGNYDLSGSLAGATLSGSVTGAHGGGSFAAAPASSSGVTAKAYCGAYSSTDHDAGWFNLVVSASGAVSGVTRSVTGQSTNGTVLSGSQSGSTLTLSSSQIQSGTATIGGDGSSLTGTFTQTGGITGSFQGSAADCGGATSATTTAPPPPLTISSLWATTLGLPTIVRAVLIGSGSAVSGSGTITVNIPSYTGDDFTITSGSYTAPNITFSGTLGHNPNGSGGFFLGSLSFTGTVNGSTMTGTLTYTPPRTATQTFSAQTATGVTMTRP